MMQLQGPVQGCASSIHTIRAAVWGICSADLARMQSADCKAHLWDASGLGGVFQLILDQVCQDISRANAVACYVSLLSHLKTNSLGKACDAVLGCIIGALVR